MTPHERFLALMHFQPVDHIPLAEQGGYMLHIDHAIPNDVPYENFAYYWERKKSLLGIQ